MAVFDKQKSGEGAGKPAQPAAPIESPELYLETVSMLANLLISNAAMMMGQVPHPQSGQTFRNLEAAELMIDLLLQIKEKASKKLPPDAIKQIGQAAANLQMLYVEEATASGDFAKANAMRKEAEAADKKMESSPATPEPKPADAAPAPIAKAAETEKTPAPDENKVKFSKKYE